MERNCSTCCLFIHILIAFHEGFGWKTCQRHKGREGWVQLTKVICVSHITSSKQILIKYYHQNLDQASTSKYQPNISNSASWLNLKFKILTKPSFRISTKIKLHNLNQASAAKYWSSFKILPILQLQNIDQTLCSKSEQKFRFMTKTQLLNLQQTVANTILSINIGNSNNLNKFWAGIFTRQGHINQVY